MPEAEPESSSEVPAEDVPVEDAAEDVVEEEPSVEEAPTEVLDEPVPEALPKPNISNRAKAAEKEAVRLSGEVTSLRKSLVGAAAIIEELDQTISQAKAENKNIGQVGIRFMRFCGKYDLNRISEQAQLYVEPFNARLVS